MGFISSSTILLLYAHLATADFPSAGQLFQLSGQDTVNNAKLSWQAVAGASIYEVEQRSGDGDFSTVGTTAGNKHDVYDLPFNQPLDWRVTARSNQTTIDQSALVSLTPFSPSADYNIYDNTVASDPLLKSELVFNKTYYKYDYEAYSNGSFSRFVEKTSSDGYTYTGNRTVLTSTILCASANYSCKLERQQFLKHPDGHFIMWAHFERSQDYALGQVAVAHASPGGELIFDGAFQPLGHDSRDMTFFADGEDAWLISSTNTNTDMNIYSLTKNWTAVDELLVQVNKAAYREAPAVVKQNGWFYLFTSRAAGWLPSQPQFIAARSMAGPWSAAVDIGNTATFASQSGVVESLPSVQSFMLADRWSANWPIAGGANRQLALPISSSGAEGFAAYHFYPTVKYSDQVSEAGQGVFGVQEGRILSVGRPSSSNAGSSDISLANDGTQDTPNAFFTPSQVPFWYQIDLGNASTVSRVELSTNMVQGSETYYDFNVTGSADGSSFSLIGSKHDNVDVGFVSVASQSQEKFRYVRLNVNSIENAHNGNEADWARGISEVTVYGQ
ncbi:hypothetical protein D6D00_02438 [Aureobasidium pullulans]|nr:hypothetical protein D6D00_02438 [Aureobasidium pullulans]